MALRTRVAPITNTLAALLLALVLGWVPACGPMSEEEMELDDELAEDGKEDRVQPTTMQWTVLVYGSYDTHEAGGLPSSLGDMKRGISATSVVNFLYLEDGAGSGNTRLWKVTKGKAEVVKDYGELHLGTPATLTSVLQLVKKQFPAPRFFLDLIGHTSSGAAAFLPDYTPDPGDWYKQRMLYWQVRKAILDSKVKIDVLALSGCGTGDLEIAARFSDVAPYVVGLQTYNTGYSDVRWANSLSVKPTIDAKGLAWRVAQGLFAKAYLQQGQSAAVGAYNSSQISAVKTAFTAFNAAIKAKGATLAKEVATARLASHQIPNSSFSFYIDAMDFAQVLQKTTTDGTLRDRAKAFQDALKKLIVAGGATTYADEEKNARAHGVNLIFMRPGAEARIMDPSDFDEASAWPASETSFYEATGWRATVTAAYPYLR